jgi:hypothetical protein
MNGGAFCFARLGHLRGIVPTPQMGSQGKIFCYVTGKPNVVEKKGKGLGKCRMQNGTEQF